MRSGGANVSLSVVNRMWGWLMVLRGGFEKRGRSARTDLKGEPVVAQNKICGRAA